MITDLEGCVGDPGTPEAPSTWLFGIEPGRSQRDEDSIKRHGFVVDSLETQRKSPFNLRAFKLFCVMEGNDIANHESFSARNPFYGGRTGYLKGNIFTEACNNLRDWPKSSVEKTGFSTKEEYMRDLKEYRWPALRRCVDMHKPSMIVCTGLQRMEDFATAFLGPSRGLSEEMIGGARGNLRVAHGKVGSTTVAVIPHLSSRAMAADATIRDVAGYLSMLRAR